MKEQHPNSNAKRKNSNYLNKIELSSKNDSSLLNQNENVKVYLRIKPSLEPNSSINHLRIHGQNSLSIYNFQNECLQNFSCDYIFKEIISNKTIFTDVALPLINFSLNGYTSTLFLYGQTGTG